MEKKNIITNSSEFYKKGDNNNKYFSSNFISEKFSQFCNYILNKKEYENEGKLHYYKSQPYYNMHVNNPYKEKNGIINLENNCYIISFLQILFHTKDFFKILKKYKNNEIINNLIDVSEHPYNIDIFNRFKQSLSTINPQYSNSKSNDSQEFGLELINYIVSYLNGFKIYNIDNEEEEDDKNLPFDLLKAKKNAINKYNLVHSKKNEIEDLFLFCQTQILLSPSINNVQIFQNLNIELTINNKMNHYIKLEDFLSYNYNSANINKIEKNKVINKKQLINLPKILIISINRVLINQRIFNNEIIFKDTLDMKNYIDNDLFSDVDKNTNFNLYAINYCYHYRNIGHNFCSIKIENNWYLFDDEKPIKEIDIQKLNKSEFVVGLFYVRESK